MTWNYPTPKDIWGEYEISGWDDTQKKWFTIWLTGIASVLMFTDQATTNRVVNKVRDIIVMSKAGALSADKALEMVMPRTIFTEEEVESMNKNAKLFGPELLKAYKNEIPSA